MTLGTVHNKPMNSPTSLMDRRSKTLGPYSPTFYDRPLHIVQAEGVWMKDINGIKYLDAYNNVPHVGHANPRVVEAITAQASTLNIHTRYLNDRVVDYAEKLLSTFAERLDRIFFANSGSEANELALRIARQRSGAQGVIVTDFSYHGTTMALAEMTTGLDVNEPLGKHVRAISIPDLDSAGISEAEALAATLAQMDRHIESLQSAGHGIAAMLFDPLFSTEGLLRIPAGLVEGLASRIHAAGGLVIADEVQSGFGRTGERMWGHELYAFEPDLVTLGKPMGNGHPLAAVVTTADLLDFFGSSNMFFNTFAGNPVSSAAGEAVLQEIEDRQLLASAESLGRRVRSDLEGMMAEHTFIRAVKGCGLYFGIDLARDGQPAPDLAKAVVEEMLDRKVLISRIGKHNNVLKIRPPLVFDSKNVDQLMEEMGKTLASLKI